MKKKVLRRRETHTKPAACFFCKEKQDPTFKNTGTLQKFITERGKIQPRARNGLCAKHQRAMALNIKYARHLSLLPFIT